MLLNLTDVTKLDQMLLNFTRCYLTWPDVTKLEQMLLNVTSFY